MESHETWLQRVKQEKRNQPKKLLEDNTKQEKKAEQVRRAWVLKAKKRRGDAGFIYLL